jgi:tripartite-type tricarboxylate transporter receptor subunit TctC
MLSRRELLIAAAAAGGTGIVRAQAYPAKPITMLVPFAAGGAADITARAVSKGLSDILKQAVVVENKPGASGIIAAEAMLARPADGYTLLLASNSITTTKWLYPHVAFDAVKDFRGIGMAMKSPHMAVVSESFPGSSIQDLVRMAKARPGTINYATAGSGTAPHLFGELFQRQTGTKMVGVPYKGSAPALAAVLSGEVNVYFDILMSSRALLSSGKAKSLAVSSAQRLPQFPSVPTFAEQGLPGLEQYSWFGVVAKAGTSDTVIEALNRALNQTVKDSQFSERANALGALAVGGTPQAFETVIRQDTARWGKVIREKNIRLE